MLRESYGTASENVHPNLESLKARIPHKHGSTKDLSENLGKAYVFGGIMAMILRQSWCCSLHLQ